MIELLMFIYTISFLLSLILTVDGNENDAKYRFFICICPFLNTLLVFKKLISYIIHNKFKFIIINIFKFIKKLYKTFKKL